jgi:hypothetical protein
MPRNLVMVVLVAEVMVTGVELTVQMALVVYMEMEQMAQLILVAVVEVLVERHGLGRVELMTKVETVVLVS